MSDFIGQMRKHAVFQYIRRNLVRDQQCSSRSKAIYDDCHPRGCRSEHSARHHGDFKSAESHQNIERIEASMFLKRLVEHPLFACKASIIQTGTASYAKLRVPRPTGILMRFSVARTSPATPALTISRLTPHTRLNTLIAAPPAKKFATICAVTA